MEFKKADSCRIQKSASSCLGFFSLSLTKGTDYSVPSVLLYGTHDKVQPYKGVRHLVDALEKHQVDYAYFEAPHSGHGVQNDDKVMQQFMKTVVEYLKTYMPVRS